MSLTIVGTIAFDSIKTPFGKADKVIVGAATYTSCAAYYLKDQIQMVSIIWDAWPSSENDKMKARGIVLYGVNVVENGRSFFWDGEYDQTLLDRTTLTTE